MLAGDARPMITLYTFGPAWGLPDPSPFVTKAEMLLKLAGLPYEKAAKGLSGAPKGKLPYLSDEGKIVADSTFIRLYLEARYGIDFDAGLSPAERGAAWAAEKLCEDHLYWLIVHARWMDDANFARGPAKFFAAVPAPLRPVVKRVVRRQIRRDLRGQGLGRHSEAEREILASRALDTLAALLADKPYLMGEKPCGADATLYAFVTGTLCPLFEARMRNAAASHPNLVAYGERLTREYYPGLNDARGEVSIRP
jgi:glutathione S-transferase